MLEVIENFRQEELKSNELFVNNLCQQIIDIQIDNFNDFIESEINSIKSLRFSWKSQDEINQALSESLPEYVDEIKVAKIFNDSCASYFNFISHFRNNGIKRYIIKNGSNKQLRSIETDIRGFIPEYHFENSYSNITYQVLATIERAQDILFTPINWVLELLPKWLMITISIILLLIFIVSIYLGTFNLSIIDAILLIISIILIFWSEPYSEIRETINNQTKDYYENKITDELDYLNNKTNSYYDNLIKILKSTNSIPATRKPTIVQTSVETDDGGNNRTNNAKDYEGSRGEGIKDSSEIIPEANDCQRNQAPVPKGD